MNGNIKTQNASSNCSSTRNSQELGAVKIPINPKHGGFIVHMEGIAKYETTATNSVLVSADTSNRYRNEDYVLVETKTNCQYLVCDGEKINKPWYKKLAANGAVIAKSAEETRAIAKQVEMDKSLFIVKS